MNIFVNPNPRYVSKVGFFYRKEHYFYAGKWFRNVFIWDTHLNRYVGIRGGHLKTVKSMAPPNVHVLLDGEWSYGLTDLTPLIQRWNNENDLYTLEILSL